jgi:hypothetical protein
MMRAGGLAVVALVVLVLAPAFACSPVVGTPLSDAPINACGAEQFSCDRYEVKGMTVKPQCNRDLVTFKSRCDFGGPGGYKYTVVINVPDSSFYAPGRTFVLTNSDLVEQPGAPVHPCRLPGCVRLPDLVTIDGQYQVTEAASTIMGMPLRDFTSIPVRVDLVPLAPEADVEATSVGLPLQDIRLASQRIPKSGTLAAHLSFFDAISVGRYTRIAYPEPPFDAFFPPVFTPLEVSENRLDTLVIGEPTKCPAGSPVPCTALDDEGGLTRTSTIQRKEGLDGWRVWLVDTPARGGRRISAIKPLSGVETTVVLHTVGGFDPAANPPSSSLRNEVEIVIAPPEGWVGVPRLQSPIPNGGPFGFRELVVPSFPPPTVFRGLVAQGDGTALTGIPSRVLFTSTGLRNFDDKPPHVLRYTTVVSTDDTGNFWTVLPVGFYDVTIEPAEGTGFAKGKETLDTTVLTSKTFHPPPRTIAFGRAVLADGRALSEATVLAVPSEVALEGSAVRPRPARTRTDREGNFRFEVDQGLFNLMVDPQPGTDFPRVVQIRSFAGATADVGEIVVAPPARLALQFKDPSDIGNPIVRAVVRVFAELPGRGAPALEIGQAMTGPDGKCEILLAPQAR